MPEMIPAPPKTGIVSHFLLDNANLALQN